MNIDFITRDEFSDFKSEIIAEIRKILKGDQKQPKWLKTKEVRAILSCSSGTLQNLRNRGIIDYTKIGGTLYYSAESIYRALENKQDKAA